MVLTDQNKQYWRMTKRIFIPHTIDETDYVQLFAMIIMIME